MWNEWNIGGMGLCGGFGCGWVEWGSWGGRSDGMSVQTARNDTYFHVHIMYINATTGENSKLNNIQPIFTKPKFKINIIKNNIIPWHTS